MLRILRSEVQGPSHLLLSFTNGVQKLVDVGPLLEGEVFEPLRDPERFAEACLDPICGTVAWPNGADFAPEALFDLPACGSRSEVESAVA